MKKTISLLLAICLITSILPSNLIAVSAETEIGTIVQIDDWQYEITSGNLATKSFDDYTRASDGGALGWEEKTIDGIKMIHPSTIGSGYSDYTMRTFFPVEGGKIYYVKNLVYNNTGSTTKDQSNAGMSAIVAAGEPVWGTFSGLEMYSHVDYGGFNSWSNESTVTIVGTRTSRTDKTAEVGLNTFEAVIKVPENVENIMVSYGAWGDTELYYGEISIYEATEIERIEKQTVVVNYMLNNETVKTIELVGYPGEYVTAEAVRVPVSGYICRADEQTILVGKNGNTVNVNLVAIENVVAAYETRSYYDTPDGDYDSTDNMYIGSYSTENWVVNRYGEMKFKIDPKYIGRKDIVESTITVTWKEGSSGGIIYALPPASYGKDQGTFEGYTPLAHSGGSSGETVTTTIELDTYFYLFPETTEVVLAFASQGFSGVVYGASSEYAPYITYIVDENFEDDSDENEIIPDDEPVTDTTIYSGGLKNLKKSITYSSTLKFDLVVGTPTDGWIAFGERNALAANRIEGGVMITATQNAIYSRGRDGTILLCKHKGNERIIVELSVNMPRQTWSAVFLDTDGNILATTANVPFRYKYDILDAIYIADDLQVENLVTTPGDIDFKSVKELSIDGHRYKLITTRLTWNAAKTECERLGGHLVTITSKKEQRIVEYLLSDAPEGEYSIGLNANNTWVTGEDSDYSNRAVCSQGCSDTNQGAMVIYNSVGSTCCTTHKEEIPMYAWGGAKDSSRYYICEWDYVTSSNSTSDNSPVIKSAEIFYKGKKYDILNQSIDINQKSGERYTIQLKIDWNNVANYNRQVYITQGLTFSEYAHFYEYNSLNETLTFVPSNMDFMQNLPIYIIAIDKSDVKAKSTSIATKINIIGKTDEEDFEISTDGIKIGKNIALTLPDDVPILGGMDLTWGLDFIPFTAAVDDEKMSIAVGIKDEVEKDKDGNIKFKSLEYQSFKEAVDNYNAKIKKAASKQNRTLKQLRSDALLSHMHKLKKPLTMSMWGGKVLKHTGSGGSDVGIDCLGYIEVPRSKTGALDYDNAHGYINFELTFSYEYIGQVFIYVVPCYYKIKGEIGGGIDAAVSAIDPETYDPTYESLVADGLIDEEEDEDVKDAEKQDPTGVYFKAKVGLGIGAGVGVPKVATFGATGEGSVNLKLGLTQSVSDYMRVFLKAKAGYELVFLGKKLASKDDVLELDPNKAIIYSTFPNDENKSWIKPSSASLLSADDVMGGYDADNVYQTESRDYLANPIVWHGDEPQMSLLAADYTNKNLTHLAEGVYPQAQPQIFAVDGKKILVFTTDNADRDDNNKQMLMYSVYNDETAIWSAPVAVDDDGTADFYPAVNGEYLVWQNQKTVMDEGLSIAQIGKLGEIVVAKWNGNGFDKAVMLTDNDTLDTLPKVAVNGDEISVVWLKNSADDILGVEGDTSIVKKLYDGSEWSEEILLKDTLNAVTDLTVGYCDEVLNVAYVHDVNGNIATIDDRELYLISTDEMQVTENEVLDSNAIINNGKLYWYSENNIQFMNLADGDMGTVFENETYVLTDGFTVSENNGNIAVLWSCAEDEGAEIKGVIYQDGAWGDVINVSELGAYAKYPTCVLEDDGTILASFTVDESDVTSLYTLGLFPSYDMAITDVYFTESILSANSEHVFTADITNTGELLVSGYTVNVYNEDGSLNNSVVFEDSIKTNETKTVTASFFTGDNIVYETLKIEVCMNDNEEYVYDNNSIGLTIGNGDICVEGISVYEMLPTSYVVATISNTGYADVSDITVSLRAGRIDGEVVQSQTISSIAVGESEEVTFAYKPTDYENIKWYITAEVDADEASDGNNYDYFINECAIGLEDYEISILNYLYADNQLTVNAYAKNNTEDVLFADAVFTVYDSDGRVKGVTTQPLRIDSYSDTGIDVWFENYTYASGDYVKMFIWSELTNLKPLVNPEQLDIVID